MRIKLLIILLFTGLFAHSQIQVQRSPKTIIPIDANLFTTFQLKIPVFPDTTTASLYITGHDSLGIIFQRRSTGQVYIRDTSAGTHKWTALSAGGGGGIWGSITGTITGQADLMALFAGKQNVITLGTTAQYFRGDLSLATFPTDNTSFTNGSGYLTTVVDTNSITGSGTTASKLKLIGDITSPGASFHYGTNGGGTKGWYADAAGGTGTVTSITAAAPLTGGTITTVGTIGIDTGAGKIATKTDIANQLTTASNGLTKVVNDIQLGGSLTKNDTIQGKAKTLLIDTVLSFTARSVNLPTNSLGKLLVGAGSTLLQSASLANDTSALISTARSTGDYQAYIQAYKSGASGFHYPEIRAKAVDSSLNLQAERIVINQDTTLSLSSITINKLRITSDSSSFRPVGINSSGVVKKMTSWFGSAGGGGGVDTGVTAYSGIVKTLAGTTITLKADTSLLATKSYVQSFSDTLRVGHAGAGVLWTGYPSSDFDSLYFKNLVAGSGVTITTQSDSSLLISSSGGGGTTNGVGRDTVQTYTTGTTLTQSASTNYIQVNPASVQAALTITTLATGGTWHTSNDLYIVFGGTVTSGNAVITAFAVTAGSGITLVQSVTPSGPVQAGEVFHYHKVGTFLYRIN